MLIALARTLLSGSVGIDQTGNCSSAELEAEITAATGCTFSCAPTSLPLTDSFKRAPRDIARRQLHLFSRYSRVPEEAFNW